MLKINPMLVAAATILLATPSHQLPPASPAREVDRIDPPATPAEPYPDRKLQSWHYQHDRKRFKKSQRKKGKR
jgi:hypothetical protein